MKSIESLSEKKNMYVIAELNVFSKRKHLWSLELIRWFKADVRGDVFHHRTIRMDGTCESVPSLSQYSSLVIIASKAKF